MKQILILMIAYTCFWTQLSSVAQTVQQHRPAAFSGVVEQAATTQPAIADGATGPALTGTDASFPMWERHPLYRLRHSDEVEITFSFAPEFNQMLTVQPDGFLTLKAVAQLYAAGRSVPELRDIIRSLYAPLLHDPEVTVSLKTFEKPYFVASGQVSKPGKYDLLGATSVVEALAIAGGMTTDAKHSKVVLFRHRSDELVEARLLDVKQMMNSRNLQEDIQLLPGDLLYVPQNSISKFRRFLPSSSLGMYVNPTQY
jgi:polysaccharide export outer membrane protein